jgi:hypothetical protein
LRYCSIVSGWNFGAARPTVMAAPAWYAPGGVVGAGVGGGDSPRTMRRRRGGVDGIVLIIISESTTGSHGRPPHFGTSSARSCAGSITLTSSRAG